MSNQQDFEAKVRQRAAIVAFWYEQYQRANHALMSGVVENQGEGLLVVADFEREAVIANMDYAQSRLNYYLSSEV